MPWEPPAERWVEVRGVRLRVYDSADLREYRGGPTLVMLHGMPGQLTNWRFQIEGLQDEFRVVAPDMRGYGRSDKPERVTFEDYLLDLDGLLRELSIRDPVLVGHSFGAMVAQVYASDREVRGLVLIGTKLSHEPDALDLMVEKLPAFLWKPLFFREHALTRALYRRMFFGREGDEAFRLFMEDNSEYIESLPARVYRYEVALRGYDAREALRRVRCPTLLVVGSEDRVTPPSESEEAARLMPNARLVVVEGAGHLILYEKPEEVNRLIREFCRGLRG